MKKNAKTGFKFKVINYFVISSFIITTFILVVFSTKYSNDNSEEVKGNLIPELHEEEEAEGKNREWTQEEADQYQAQYTQVKKAISSLRTSRNFGSYANGNINGSWRSRGPHNMPGTFQFCEVDEGTDTVYAVTTGHYGAKQFIWKGTLWDDKWELITLRHPSRFNDVIALPKGSKRRVLAGHQKGKIMYSDNSGKDWEYSSGPIESIQSTIVNRQDNNVLYATNKSKVFISSDVGSSFREFQSFGNNASNVCMYSPRWSSQPGASSVYLVRDSKVYRLNSSKTAFEEIGSTPTGGGISMSGDSRKLWIVLGRRKWHSSTNNGRSFSYVSTTNYYYNNKSNDMYSGQFIGVNPEDPNILIGGYTVPLITKNAGATTNADGRRYWGRYQNSTNNDPKVRINYHPDFQSNQFFYDKDGKLMTLRSSDGGVFISYNEWIKNGFPNYSDIQDVYYNISLFGKPTQETYRGGFMYGYLHPDHLTCGTQDQGWQDVRPSTYGSENLSWNQIQGGDGPNSNTGDGKIGWRFNYQGTGNFRRIELYSGTTYKGQKGNSSAAKNFNFTRGSHFTSSVCDWEDGDRIWLLNQSLRRVEYNASNGQMTAKEDFFGNGNESVQGIAQSRVNADVILAMRKGVVYKSVNRGDSWTQVASANETGITGYNSNRGMGWSSPLDQNIALFATQSRTAVKSIYTSDGGVTWENVTGSGQNKFPTAEVNGMAGSSDGKFVFASTNSGPYLFVVDEKKWYPLLNRDDGVPMFYGHVVHCVKYGDKEIVHFSTWGQGMWDFNIQNVVYANDVSITNITAPTGVKCDGMVSLVANIKNIGANQINSISIDIFINNQYERTHTYNTSLASSKNENITLPEIYLSKTSEVTAKVKLINNSADENPSNDSRSITLTKGAQINKKGLKVISASSYEDRYDRLVTNLIDGDISTLWHAKWTEEGSQMPHEIIFDLGSIYDLTGIGWVNRQGNPNGNTKTAELFISEDQLNWNSPQKLNIADVNTEQLFDISIGAGRYVKLLITSNHDGTNISSLAEIKFFGCETSLDISTIDNIDKQVVIYPSPASDIVTVKSKNVESIQLLNMDGKLLESYLSEGDQVINNIDISSISAGVYLLRLRGKNKDVVRKIIKN